MSDIWIYRRRPSSLTRYRHGGAAAFDPAVRSPLARGVTVVAPSETSEDEKILQFPSATVPNQRPKRSGKPRRGRAKPKTPKKRD